MSKTILSGTNTDIFIIKRKAFHFVLVMEPQDCRLRETVKLQRPGSSFNIMFAGRNLD